MIALLNRLVRKLKSMKKRYYEKSIFRGWIVRIFTKMSVVVFGDKLPTML